MTEPTYSTEDLLIGIGRHLKAIRASVGIVAFLAAIQLVILALWIFGAVTVAFDQNGGF